MSVRRREAVVDSAELLERCVVSAIRPNLGATLESVTYRCLEHEAVSSDLDDPEFYSGGELLLTFDRQPLYISWDENAGWESHFSVAASSSSLFKPDARIEQFDGSSLPLWLPHLGSPLVRSKALGWDEAPYMVQLLFVGGSVVVGSGSRTSFGDGDDVLVRGAECLDALPAPDLLWDSVVAA
jgi:hypothetical protein